MARHASRVTTLFSTYMSSAGIEQSYSAALRMGNRSQPGGPTMQFNVGSPMSPKQRIRPITV